MSDPDWHDRINEMEDEARLDYFRTKSAEEYRAQLAAQGKKAHICPHCLEIIDCDTDNKPS